MAAVAAQSAQPLVCVSIYEACHTSICHMHNQMSYGYPMLWAQCTQRTRQRCDGLLLEAHYHLDVHIMHDYGWHLVIQYSVVYGKRCGMRAFIHSHIQ
jgi:hypothetical protein